MYTIFCSVGLYQIHVAHINIFTVVNGANISDLYTNVVRSTSDAVI